MPEDPAIGFDPAQDVRLDPRNLRGLAHPLRVSILGELRRRGPATASRLAERLNQSSGATSYHLRQLAAYGFVVEQPGGSGKQRWWRAAHRGTYYDWSALADQDEQTRTAGAEYLRAVARTYADQLYRYTDSVDTAEEVYGPDWVRAFDFSDYALELTAAEASALVRSLHEVVQQLREATDGRPALVAGAAEPGRLPVTVQLSLLPNDRS